MAPSTTPCKQLQMMPTKLEEWQNGDLYVYCQSGYRSVVASSLSNRNGIRSVKNVLGGFQEISKTKIKINLPSFSEKLIQAEAEIFSIRFSDKKAFCLIFSSSTFRVIHISGRGKVFPACCVSCAGIHCRHIRYPVGAGINVLCGELFASDAECPLRWPR